MIDYILGLFTNDIICRTDPHSFYFTQGNKSLQVQTYVYVSGDNPPRIMSVGNEFPGFQNCRKISLFERAADASAISKGEYLDAFLRYAFASLARTRAIVRPKVIFKNSQSLQEYLSGYQQSVLSDAAARPGAREIHFKD